MTRKLAPCGTIGGYGRHRARGEEICEPCREACREYHRARRAAGYTAPGTGRRLAPCGTYAAAQRHRAHGEPLCSDCVQADHDYQAAWQRNKRAEQKERRQALDQMLAEVLAETASP